MGGLGLVNYIIKAFKTVPEFLETNFNTFNNLTLET